jgi:hypothetical protein
VNVVPIDRRRHRALRNIGRLPAQMHLNRRLLPLKAPPLIPDVPHGVPRDLRRIGSLSVTVRVRVLRLDGTAVPPLTESERSSLGFGSAASILADKMFQFL